VKTDVGRERSLKGVFPTVLLVLLLLNVTVIMFRTDVANSSQIWTVDDDGPADFATIQEALDSPSVLDGDTIFVYSGTYHQHLNLTKSISLVGEDPLSTIMDGDSLGGIVVNIYDISNVLLENFMVRNTTSAAEAYGIQVYRATNITIRNVIITDAYYGVMVNNSTQCRILDNKIQENDNSGVVFRGNSSNNLAVGNLISSNPTGIYIESYSKYNVFYHNNVIGNSLQINPFPYTYSIWHNGVEGNYWGDYAGVDTDGDGIGETLLPHQGVDYYPLVEPWSQTRTYNVDSYQVVVNCNYTVASFDFNDTINQTSFYITGPAGWSGFCNVTIPKGLLNPKPPSEGWIVILGTNAVAYLNESVDDSTLLSFTYTLGASMQENRVRIRAGILYPPTASFEFTPDPASTIEPVNFTDTSTDSPNGTIIWQEWDFGDGYVVYNETFVSHQFATKAFFNVTLTVGDNNSQTDSITRRVWVRNLQPYADFTYTPTEPSVGSVSFNASTSEDPDGSIVEYRWDFDDGTVDDTISPTTIHGFEHAGTYDVTLAVVDNDGGKGNKTLTVQVGKGTTHVVIEAPDDVTVERTFTLSATLEDGVSQPLSSKQISFDVYNGELVLNVNRTTNSSGVATADFSLSVVGEYNVRAEFQGSNDYLESYDITIIMVNPLTTSLTLQSLDHATVNEQLNLSALLLDAYENPIPDATVEFHLYNGSAWNLLGSSETSQNGVTSISYMPALAGNFTLKATFNGTAKYASSTSDEQVLMVVAPQSDYTSIIILVVVIALASALVFIVLRRRKPK
jgi:parallel beta-helix repeat protein